MARQETKRWLSEALWDLGIAKYCLESVDGMQQLSTLIGQEKGL